MFPQAILRLFFVDENTLGIAIIPLQLAVFAHVLDGYGKILAAALIGAGATRAAIKSTLNGWFRRYNSARPSSAIKENAASS